jgi:hypothetical protein
MSAAAESFDDRARLYARLTRRNQIVGVLRILVPLIGGIFLAFLLIQIALSRLDEGFEIGPIRVDRDTVSFQDPRYNGVTSNGMTYEVLAATATAPIGVSDRVQLTEAELILSEPGRPQTFASAPEAEMNIDASKIKIEGAVDISNEQGTTARMYRSILDWQTRNLSSEGPVHVDYFNGIVIDADTLTYDGENLTWRFENVRMHLPAEYTE